MSSCKNQLSSRERLVLFILLIWSIVLKINLMEEYLRDRAKSRAIATYTFNSIKTVGE